MIIWTSEFTFINKAFVLATNLAYIIKHFKSTNTYLKQLKSVKFKINFMRIVNFFDIMLMQMGEFHRPLLNLFLTKSTAICCALFDKICYNLGSFA